MARSSAAPLGAVVAGPDVRPPHSAADLPVLGGVALPGGTVPDPAAAVHRTPSVLRGVAERGAAPALRPAGYATARQRWESAVAARPLEAPRTLPAAFHPMARVITGTARPPRFTTGPATRHALAAAGALGATTGSVVHLAAVPAGAPAAAAVLAHELAHTRRPVRRPRFLLAGASSLLDDDEREARTAGHDPLSGRLPDGSSGAAPAALGAGIVGGLPVGGGLGAVGEMATRAARAAVIEATAALPFDAGVRLPGPDGQGAGSPGPAGVAVTAPAVPATGGVTGAASSAGSAVAGPADPSTAGASQSGTAGTGAPLDADRVVELVEERLLREIERRGGRWAGVF